MEARNEIRGTAAGVPYVALAPREAVARPGLVVGWHLMDAPNTETGMAAAVPMAGLNVWRVYFGLPMHSGREPAGGPEESYRLAVEDAVLNVYGSVAQQALDEFPAALAEVRDRLSVPAGPIGLFGGSFGAAVAQLALLESAVEVDAIALVSPVIQLAGIIAANERRYGMTYGWSDESRQVADRLDFLARADEIVREDPAVLIAIGAQDVPEVTEPANGLWELLSRKSTDPARISLLTVPGMEHALAEEPVPGQPADATPTRTSHAVSVDNAMTAWFDSHLGATSLQ